MLRTPLTRRMPIKGASALTSQLRDRKCSNCGTPFKQQRMGQQVCSAACASSFARRLREQKERKELRAAKAAQRADRAATKAALEKLKTKGEWLADLQRVFNAYIRERDRDQSCICCGRTNVKDYLTGSAWDAGHYRSVGSAPHLRFDERNVHRQLVYCNRDRSGNAVEYRGGLIARIGLAAVEALEADNAPRHYTIDQLKAMKAEYAAKLRAMKEKA
jgi:hypothetical protein